MLRWRHVVIATPPSLAFDVPLQMSLCWDIKWRYQPKSWPSSRSSPCWWSKPKEAPANATVVVIAGSAVANNVDVVLVWKQFFISMFKYKLFFYQHFEESEKFSVFCLWHHYHYFELVASVQGWHENLAEFLATPCRRLLLGRGLGGSKICCNIQAVFLNWFRPNSYKCQSKVNSDIQNFFEGIYYVIWHKRR